MPKVTVYVDPSKAIRKMKLLQAKLKAEGSLSIKEIGELGKSYAKARAPYFSGKTFDNIILRMITGPEVIIQARNSTAGRADGFNLPRWMHTSPRARSHIGSGDPKFMYRTASYLRKVAPGRVQGRFSKVVAQINRT